MSAPLFENFYTAYLFTLIADLAVFVAENNTSDGKFNADADEADHAALEAKLAEHIDPSDYPAPILLDYDFSEEERNILLAQFNKVYRANMLAYELEAKRN